MLTSSADCPYKVVGIFTFSLMVRKSMLVGWWELFRGVPQRSRPLSLGLAHGGETKHVSLGMPLASEREPYTAEPEGRVRLTSAPEPGDVATRHETTTLFDDTDDEIDVDRRRPTYDDGTA